MCIGLFEIVLVLASWVFLLGVIFWQDNNMQELEADLCAYKEKFCLPRIPL